MNFLGRNDILRFGIVPLYFTMLITLFIGLYFPDFYSSNVFIISELVNTSIITSIILIKLSYKYRFCLYHKVCTWSFLASGIFNLLAIGILESEHYELYINLYAHFLLIPTTVIITYMIIREI